MLILLSAFCSGSETACFSLSQPERLKVTSRSPKFFKVAFNKLPDILVVILFFNLCINVAFSFLFERLIVLKLGHSGKDTFVLSVVVPVFLLVLFGELIPKYWSYNYRTHFSYIMLPVWYVLSTVMQYVVKFLDYIPEKIGAFVFKVTLPEKKRSKKKEMSHLLSLARRKGSISITLQKYMENIAELHDLTVSELMIPRKEVELIPEPRDEAHLRQTLSTLSSHRFYPVYRHRGDQIVGILDVASWYLKNDSFKNHIRPCVYIPDTARLFQLWELFKKENPVPEMILAVDEYGSFQGVVTQKIFLEILTLNWQKATGQIHDSVTYLGKGVYVVDGDTPLWELEKHLRADFSEAHSDTLNGLVMDLTGNLPEKGITLEFGNLKIKIIKIAGLKVGRALIWKENK